MLINIIELQASTYIVKGCFSFLCILSHILQKKLITASLIVSPPASKNKLNVGLADTQGLKP